MIMIIFISKKPSGKSQQQRLSVSLLFFGSISESAHSQLRTNTAKSVPYSVKKQGQQCVPRMESC